MIALLLLALAQQKPEVRIIERRDPQKELYARSVRSCEQAAKLLDSDPEGALQKLAEVHEKLDPADKKGLEHYEKLLRFELLSDDYADPVPFYPFQLRGRARQRLAAAAKDLEERRRLLTEAAADLQKSVERGVKESEAFLQEVKAETAKLPPPAPPVPTAAELAGAWVKEWAALRPRLALATYVPGDAALPAAAGALLRRMASQAAARDQVDAASWLLGEAEAARGRLPSLSRDEARKTLNWCETLAAAAGEVETLRGFREMLARVRAEAARIAEHRGSFTLKIGPAPYATELRVLREGKEIALPSRDTPVVLSDLEIGDFVVELSHPEGGKRTIAIAASSLKEGKVYLLRGRMKGGELLVAPLP